MCLCIPEKRPRIASLVSFNLRYSGLSRGWSCTSIDRLSASLMDQIFYYADSVPGNHVVGHTPASCFKDHLGEPEESTNHVDTFPINPKNSKGSGFQDMIRFRYCQRPYGLVRPSSILPIPFCRDNEDLEAIVPVKDGKLGMVK
jgi:hypothetical protein